MRIAHLSDIHIHTLKRHWEYRKLFKSTYDSLKEKKPDIIVVTGDIAHGKTNISNEQVEMTSEFFKSLSDITDTIIIPGQHDTNLANEDRLDAITPIVNALERNNIRYYKKSGIYQYNLDINFVVFSCFDSFDKWPTELSVDKTKINIGLYHGFVKEAVLQNGISAESAKYSTKDFLRIVDYLLMGDIHRMQILDETYKAAYAGPLIQQGYGETPTKGYLLWDIESKEKHNVDFVEIFNTYPFYTVTYKGDIESFKDLNLQKRSRIRIFCDEDVDVFEKQKIKERVHELYEPRELKVLDSKNAHRQEIKLDAGDIVIENIGDLTVQEKLIRLFFKSSNLDEEILKKILRLNELYNTEVRTNESVLRNVQYKIGKVTWSNIGSFGENNEFDFSAHRGITGIFGKNGSGKSTVAVDVLQYCMFNRVSKNVTKNDLLINENKVNCCAEEEIYVGPNKHTIKRSTSVYLKSGKKEDNPVFQGKTEVDYRVAYPDGSVVIKNGIERADTDNNFIRKDFGTVEDFMDTSVSPQGQLLNFIDKGPTERQRLIGRYFDIDIFEKKFELAKKRIKEIKAELSVLENFDFNSIESYRKLIVSFYSELEDLDKKKVNLEKEIEQVENNISSLSSEMVKIDSADNEHEDDLLDKIKLKETYLETLKDKKNKAQELLKKKSSFDIKKIQQEAHLVDDIERLQSKLSALMHSCDCKHEPNCSHAKKIIEFQSRVQDLLRERTMKEYPRNLLNDYYSIVLDKNDYDSMISQTEEIISQYKKNIDLIANNREQFIKNEVIKIQLNKEQEILKEKKNALELLIKSVNSNFLRFGEVKAKLQALESSFVTHNNLKEQYQIYDYFLQAMSKDGISRLIISENINLINKEIEKILSQGVGFTVELESSENGKAIDIYFRHPRSKKRIIELCSGMEKVLSSIAIRAALVNITTLPKSNLFIVDEPEYLDAEYLSGLVSMLEYLKQQFENIIIITHNDALKDIVDHIVEVERDENGYSRIC